jgi:murein DD-endopeptidase MepM/ murein hydrolase activator NlpD
MRRFLLVLTASLVLAAQALTAPALARAAWVWPVSGDVITPYRNGTVPYATGQHRGIDIAAPVGTPVVAASGGDVRFAGTAGSSGVTISVRTDDGYDTSYLHLSSVAVRAGAHVSGGERIGAVGTTGTRSAAAPHLHFGVRDAGTRHDYHDPLALLPAPPAPARLPNPPVPATVPVPRPAPPAAAPAPATRTQPAPRPAPRQAPHSAPHRSPAPRPAPHTAPRRAPHPAPHAAPRLAPQAAPRLAPQPATRRAPHAAPQLAPQPATRGAPHRAPRLAPRRAPHPALRLAPHPVPGRSSRAAPRPARLAPHLRPRQSADARRDAEPAGPDRGWALACGALLLAAAVLGLSGDARDDRAPRLARFVRLARASVVARRGGEAGMRRVRG